MIEHYLKIGLRNICRYKQQSVVSIVGLAIGFVCFALSLLWVRYELSYIQGFPDSERIYLITTKRYNPFLKKTFTYSINAIEWLSYLKKNSFKIIF